MVAVSTGAVAEASGAAPAPAADVQSVMIVPGDNGPVVQVVATRPLTPSFQTLAGPLRLVIDLPDAKLTTARRRIPFRNEQIKGIRIDQFQTDPAVVRVVVDLSGAGLYQWGARGNRLLIRLHAEQTATGKPHSVHAVACDPEPALVAGAVRRSGTQV